MNTWNPGGKRPRTLGEWGAFVDGLSRHQRNQLYPGMHKDLIPATEMIDAGWTGQSGDRIEDFQSEPQNENIDYSSLAREAASALEAGANEFRALADAQQNGSIVDEDEIMRLRQLGVRGPAALNTLANACDSAASALHRPLRFVLTDACDGDQPTACSDVGGFVVRITREFADNSPARQVSILAHEGVHLSGTVPENGPGGAETVESAVFDGLSKPPVAPL